MTTYQWTDDTKVNIISVDGEGNTKLLEPGAKGYSEAKATPPDEPSPVTLVAPKPPVQPDDIKDEASRRIIVLCPEWKQRNLTARAAELVKKGQDNWTPEETSEWESGEALWAKIKHIREKSNEIELMEPIPQDYRDDSYWT